MCIKLTETKHPDAFTDFLNDKIKVYVEQRELCVVREANLSEDAPEATRLMYNSQAANLFDMAYEYNIILERYNSHKAGHLAD